MNDMIDALKLALATLEDIFGKNKVDVGAINVLRQAIAEAEKQEPFGYFRYDIRLDALVQIRNSNQGVAFYTHPQPKREWVGLTDKEMEKLSVENDKATFLNDDEETDILWFDGDCFALLRAAEAKLKEKNT